MTQHPLRTNCPICHKEGKPRRKYSNFWGHINLEHGMTQEQFRNHPDYKSIRVHDTTTPNLSSTTRVVTKSTSTKKSVLDQELILTVSQEDIKLVLPRVKEVINA